MKKLKKDTKVAIILIIIAIVVTGIIFFMTRKDKGEAEKGNTSTNTNTQKVDEKYVDVLEDGSKVNTSSKLQKSKKIDDLEITDIQFTERENNTVLIATVTNTSSTEQGGYSIDIKVLDEKGNEKGIIPGYIAKVQPNESTKLNASILLGDDVYIDAYDIQITKSE